MINCDCPHCGSRNTKALSLLYCDGTKDQRWQSSAWFYYRRRFGVRSSIGRGRSQTLAAQLAAPPVPSSTRLLRGAGVPLALFAGAAVGGSVGLVLALACLIWFAVSSGEKEALSAQQRMRDWSSTFRCGRCGTVFAVIEPSELNSQ